MLNTQPTDLAYDDMYEALIAMHAGLTTQQSHAANARLVLLLANHVADLAVLKEAFALARRAAVATSVPESPETPAAITPVAPVHAG